MRILIESTEALTTLDGVRCRLWQGTTEDNTPCDVFVLRVASADPWAQEALARELTEPPRPREATLGDLATARLCERLALLEPVVEAARRAVNGQGVIKAAEWEALCRAVARLDGPAPGSTTV
jgi:hypothetical protein